MSIALGVQLTKRYQILSKLGEGGFGTTFLAKDLHLPGDRLCVVKQLKSQTLDSLTWQTAKRLFDTEARTLYQLGNHSQIPELYAYFEENRQFYLVEEYIPGHNLALEIADRTLRDKEDRLIAILCEILEILEYVHACHVIHRDINPHNIIRRKQDCKLVLIDFGAVKQITNEIISGRDRRYTIAIGTPGYRPGEQANGNPKLNSDIYAVGAIGIQALTNRLPHTLSLNPTTGEIDWQAPAHISRGLINVLDRMVRYDWRERYQSAAEAKQALLDLIAVERNFTTAARAVVPPPCPKKPPRSSLPSYLGAETNIFSSCLSRLFVLIILLALGVSGMASFYRWQNFLSAAKFSDRATILSQARDYERALDLYYRAIEVAPNYHQAWKGRADILLNLKRYKEAQIAYQKATTLQPNDWQSWLKLAELSLKSREYSRAIAAFKKVVALQPDYWQGWQSLAELQLKLNAYREATVSLANLLKLQPENAKAWYQSGYAFQNLSEYRAALISYNKALQLQPKNAKLWYQSGNVLMNLKKYREAERSYRQSVIYQPNFELAWYSRGMAFSYLKDYYRAIYAFDRALKIKANYPQAWYHRGWANHQLKKYQAAISDYNKAIKYKSNYEAAWYNKGNAYYNLKQYQNAIKAYDRAIKIKPNYALAWYSRGNAFLKLKQYDRAAFSFDRALHFNPNYTAAKKSKQLLNSANSKQ